MTLIFKMLDVSSSHVTHTTAVHLPHNKFNSVLTVQKWFDEGWIISVPDKEDMLHPMIIFGGHRALAAVLLHAQKLGCEYIKLDADGDIIDGLETYNW